MGELMSEAYNSIRLIGNITSAPRYDHTVLGEDFFRITVSAARLSGTEDLLPVTLSDRLIGASVTDSVHVGDNIDVNGQIRSYNQRSVTGTHLILTVFPRELALIRGSAGIDIPDRNDVEIIGRIVKPVVYRTTPFSREIADILIVVERRYGKSDILPCIAWGRNARYASELSAGDTVLIRGRLQSRQYEKQLDDGSSEKRTAYEISCSSLEKR